MTTPLVSVVMPCYNHELFIREAIDSVLSQTLKDFELIVVNDGSTDCTSQTLTSYASDITLVNQPHRGPSAARNSGIRRATGKYVAFLDGDDFWHPDFLSRMVEGMKDPSVALCYCGWQNIGLKAGKPFVPPDYETPEKLHHFLRFAAPWAIHAAMIRRDKLPKPNPFDEDLLSCEDYDLWLKVGAVHRIQRVPYVLAYYRRHNEGQITSNQAQIAYSNLLVKKRFLQAHPEIRKQFSSSRLREYCAGALLDRGYRCLWGGHLASAHKILRYALLNRLIQLRDLKYALPTLLPYHLYLRLLKGRGLKKAQ